MWSFWGDPQCENRSPPDPGIHGRMDNIKWHARWGMFLSTNLAFFSCQSSSKPTYLTDWLTEWVTDDSSIQSDRRGNVHATGQITSNFLKQASLRLYEIRQPRTSLCTTSNFLTNTMVIIFHMVILVIMIIMVEMVIVVKMVIRARWSS